MAGIKEKLGRRLFCNFISQKQKKNLNPKYRQLLDEFIQMSNIPTTKDSDRKAVQSNIF